MVYGMGYSLLRSRFTLFNSNNDMNMQDTIIHVLAMNAYQVHIHYSKYT